LGLVAHKFLSIGDVKILTQFMDQDKHPHFRDFYNEFKKVKRNHGNVDANKFIGFTSKSVCVI